MGYYSDIQEYLSENESSNDIFLNIKNIGQVEYFRALPLKMQHKGKKSPFFTEIVIWIGKNRIVSPETWGDPDPYFKIKKEVDDNRFFEKDKQGRCLINRAQNYYFPGVHLDKHYEPLSAKFLNAQYSLRNALIASWKEYDDISKYGIADLKHGYDTKIGRLSKSGWNVVNYREPSEISREFLEDLEEYDLIGRTEEKTLDHDDLIEYALDWVEKDGLDLLEKEHKPSRRR